MSYSLAPPPPPPARGCWAVIVAAELVALQLVMQFWTDRVPAWACKNKQIGAESLSLDLCVTCFLAHHTGSAIFLVLVLALNLFGARSYGEAEYWFSMVSRMHHKNRRATVADGWPCADQSPDRHRLYHRWRSYLGRRHWVSIAKLMVVHRC